MSFALVLSPGSPAPPAETIRAALERHLLLHPIESATVARQHGGIIVPREPAKRLTPLAAGLAEAGVKTAIVPADRLASIDRSTRANGISFDGDDVIFHQPLGAESRVPRPDVVGGVLWGLPSTGDDEKGESDEASSWFEAVRQSLDGEENDEPEPTGSTPAEGCASLARKLAGRLAAQGLGSMSLILTVYTRSPLRAFRCAREDLGFASLGERKAQNSLGNFLLLLAGLVERLPDDCRLESLRQFLDDPRPQELLRDSEKEAANQDRWFLYWVGADKDEN